MSLKDKFNNLSFQKQFLIIFTPIAIVTVSIFMFVIMPFSINSFFTSMQNNVKDYTKADCPDMVKYLNEGRKQMDQWAQDSDVKTNTIKAQGVALDKARYYKAIEIGCDGLIHSTVFGEHP